MTDAWVILDGVAIIVLQRLSCDVDLPPAVKEFVVGKKLQCEIVLEAKIENEYDSYHYLHLVVKDQKIIDPLSLFAILELNIF